MKREVNGSLYVSGQENNTKHM